MAASSSSAYTVSDIHAPTPSGITYIDALLDDGPNFYLLTPARNVLYYTFPTTSYQQTLYGTSTPNYAAMNSTQMAAVVSALAEATRVTGIQFQQVSSNSQADLFFGNYDLTGSNISGLCSWRTSYTYTGTTLTNYSVKAFVYLDNNEYASDNTTPTVGTEGYQILLHEIGHALGLKHPFAGDSVLSDDADNTGNTVMSYTWTGDPKTTYSPYDVAALSYLYGNDGLTGSLGVQPGAAGIMLVGTSGNDTFSSGTGNDRIEAGDGNDTIYAGQGNDVILASIGDDMVYSGKGNDEVRLGIGNDYAAAGQGNDTLYGADGQDFMDAALGDDRLQGGNGNDTLIGGGGNDTLIGGPGADVFVLSTLADVDRIEGFSASDGDRLLLAANSSYTVGEDTEGAVVFLAGSGTTLSQTHLIGVSRSEALGALSFV